MPPRATVTVTVRMEPMLHERAIELAAKQGVSLDRLVEHVLGLYVDHWTQADQQTNAPK